MIRTIVTATDGSPHARDGIELAVELAGKFAARLVIMHAIGEGAVPDELIHLAEVEHIAAPPAPDPSMPRAPIPRTDGDRRHETHQIHEFIGNKLLDEAEGVAKAYGLKNLGRVIADGDPASAILKTAVKEKADMIVIGSRGLGTLKGLLLGSVSQKVSHLAKCTTVCVK